MPPRSSEVLRLQEAAADAIRSAWPAVGTHEPKSVFDLFCTVRARTAWTSAFGAAKVPVSYSAVFTHQRPYVSFSTSAGPGRCELADLLLVASFPERRRRRAILLQAKMLNGIVWPPSDAQWQLYTSWPAFSYSVGSKRRTAVQMPAARPLGRAQYLVLPPIPAPIVLRPHRPPPPHPWPPHPFVLFHLICDDMRHRPRRLRPGWPVCLSGLVADLVREDAGAAFPYQPKQAMLPWSQLVWDLLSVTASQNAPAKQVAAPKGTPRGNLMLFATAGAGGAGGGVGGGEDLPGEEAPTEGFGVVEFTVGAGAGVEVPAADGAWTSE